MTEAMIIQMRDVAMDITRPTVATHKEVQYTIDGKGPFSLFMSMGDFSAQKALDMVKEKTAEWAAVVGKTVKV